MVDKTAILFSRTVKAGKRVYYIDVKQDKRGEFYLSFTESKRLQDTGDQSTPIFEKHKIFIYREDLEKFSDAFTEVLQFVNEHQQGRPHNPEEIDTPDYRFDVEF